MAYSNVFKWTGKTFLPYQQIDSAQPNEMAFVTYRGATYAAVCLAASFTTLIVQIAAQDTNPSTVYRWDQSSQFTLLQTITTNQACDIAFAEIDSVLFMVIPTNASATFLYTYNQQRDQFDLHQVLLFLSAHVVMSQSIPTPTGDYSATFYFIGSQAYLAIAGIGYAPQYDVCDALVLTHHTHRQSRRSMFWTLRVSFNSIRHSTRRGVRSLPSPISEASRT